MNETFFRNGISKSSKRMRLSHRSAEELNACRRILIIRFGDVADLMHALPVLNTLRTRFHRAEIAWLVEDKHAGLLFGHPALDRLILTKKRWLKTFEETKLLRKRLQAFTPDVVIDLQSDFKSSFAAWLSDAKYRIGFGGGDGRGGSRWLNNILIRPREQHAVERNLELLYSFGIEGSSINFDVPECETDRYAALTRHRELGIGSDFVILHLGAEAASKRWQPDRYAELALYLKEQWNLPSLILSRSPEEKPRVEEILRNAPGTRALPTTISLGELTSLSRMATLFIGGNTSSLHMAAAVGTPCIGLFETPGERNAPYGHRNRVVFAREGQMEAIETAHVCQVCDEVLSCETELRNNPIYSQQAHRHVA